jgi:hypothetical protein
MPTTASPLPPTPARGTQLLPLPLPSIPFHSVSYSCPLPGDADATIEIGRVVPPVSSAGHLPFSLSGRPSPRALVELGRRSRSGAGGATISKLLPDGTAQVSGFRGRLLLGAIFGTPFARLRVKRLREPPTESCQTDPIYLFSFIRKGMSAFCIAILSTFCSI